MRHYSEVQYTDTRRTVFADEQGWAVSREQRIGLEPLIEFGERVIVRKVWQIHDFTQGRVERCKSCHAGGTPEVQQRVSSVYKQAGESRCLECYGTGFEGGFQPDIFILHMLATDDPENITPGRSGAMTENYPNVQFSGFVPLNEHDLVVRVEEWDPTLTYPVKEIERCILMSIMPITIRSGKRNPAVNDSLVGQTSSLRNLPPEHIYYEVPVKVP